MQMKNRSKECKKILCLALIVAMALLGAGCGQGGKDSSTAAVTETAAVSSAETDAQAEESKAQGSSSQAEEARTEANAVEKTVLGEGNKSFDLTVADSEGRETFFEIHTDKETVGEALVELELIAGEGSEYGLYVKTVNGVTADYDKDGSYWAFYVNGEYASSGVDSTAVAEGDQYAFRIEK